MGNDTEREKKVTAARESGDMTQERMLVLIIMEKRNISIVTEIRQRKRRGSVLATTERY